MAPKERTLPVSFGGCGPGYRPMRGLICVGTSATIGGAGDEKAILDYVSGVFQQPFSSDAIVGEVRQGIDEFLRDAIISYHLAPQPDLAQRLDPRRYASLADYICAQHEVFFGEPPAGEFESLEWRLELGKKLREHASFVNLLRVMDGSKPVAAGTVLDRLQRSLPLSGIDEAAMCLDSLYALISVAREREGDDADATVGPLLNLKVHLWVRELRRMVCSVYEEVEEPIDTDLGGSPGSSDDGNQRLSLSTSASMEVDSIGHHAEASPVDARNPIRRIRYADDLKPDEESIHLPLLQCRECHATAWGCVKHASENQVGQDLRTFYNRFFLRDVDVNYLFPMSPDEPPPQNVSGQEMQVAASAAISLLATPMNAPVADRSV